MKIKHIRIIIEKVMNKLDSIDFIDMTKRKYNQKQVNEAYTILDNFKDELIRENIKKKQEEGTNDTRRFKEL